MEHKLDTLPKWARDRILLLEEELKRISMMHELLMNRDWFTIRGPQEGIERLFYLSKEGAHCACSLRPGDALIVVRKKP